MRDRVGLRESLPVLTSHRTRRGQRGQILIMFAFSMVLLIIGMIAVAVDLSQLYEARVRLQNAAEQGALAGASQVDYVAAESGNAALLPSFRVCVHQRRRRIQRGGGVDNVCQP